MVVLSVSTLDVHALPMANRLAVAVVEVASEAGVVVAVIVAGVEEVAAVEDLVIVVDVAVLEAVEEVPQIVEVLETSKARK